VTNNNKSEISLRSEISLDTGVEYISGKSESSPGHFPGFRRLREAESSSGLKGSEIL